MKKFLWLVAVGALLFTACGEDDEPTPVEVEKSSEKQINSFVFTSLTPNVTATIDEGAKMIEAEVSFDTDITALEPTIEISAKAAVAPGSNETVDFTNDVVYTVTAEDESTVEYTVSITKKSPPLTIDPIVGGTERERGAAVLVSGDNFVEGSMQVFLIKGEEEFEMNVAAQTDEVVTFLISHEIDLGEYQLKLTDGERFVVGAETITVTIESPVVTATSEIEVVQGEGFVIEGEYFSETNTEVYLGSNQLEIVSTTSARIEVIVPETVEAGEYTLKVTANGKEVFYSEQISVIVDPTSPVISSINEVSYNRGETMIITGENLKKDGVATNINFIPFTGGGSTIVRSASANADGTEVTYTIPADFQTGTYTIVVEVDFIYSNEYDEVIQINP